jgi:hypothetical protein
MGTSITAQIEAATAKIQGDVAGIASDLDAIKSEIAALVAQLQPGNVVQQATIDGLNVQVAALDAVKTAADAAAVPVAGAPTPAAV